LKNEFVWVIHKEGLCLSSGDINRLVVMNRKLGTLDLCVEVGERRAWRGRRRTAVHLKRTHCRHHHGAVRAIAARAALYVEELLHTCTPSALVTFIKLVIALLKTQSTIIIVG
jgi:hypothetical protein